MKTYILGILGIVLAGILIEIVVPSGEINKYIKSVFSIFVIAVILSPIVTILNKGKEFNFNYSSVNLDLTLSTYIANKKIDSIKNEIKTELENDGITNFDIYIDYSIENDKMVIISSTINLKNMTSLTDKQHINNYEKIKSVVLEKTGLTEKELVWIE